jgi:prophage regulatory protein
MTTLSRSGHIGYLRVRDICGDPNSNPPISPILPIGKSTWWRWVQCSRAPKGLKLSPGVTVWRAEDVYALAEKMGGAE